MLINSLLLPRANSSSPDNVCPWSSIESVFAGSAVKAIFALTAC